MIPFFVNNVRVLLILLIKLFNYYFLSVLISVFFMFDWFFPTYEFLTVKLMIFPCKAYFDVEGSIEKFVTLYDLIGVINCNFCFGFLNYKLIVFGSTIKSPKRGFTVLFFY